MGKRIQEVVVSTLLIISTVGRLAPATPAFASCAPEDPIYKISKATRVWKRTVLRSSCIEGPVRSP